MISRSAIKRYIDHKIQQYLMWIDRVEIDINSMFNDLAMDAYTAGNEFYNRFNDFIIRDRFRAVGDKIVKAREAFLDGDNQKAHEILVSVIAALTKIKKPGDKRVNGSVIQRLIKGVQKIPLRLR